MEERTKAKKLIDNLIELPGEMLAAISTHLGPNDLLNLSKTCKKLNDILFGNKFDQIVWKPRANSIVEIPLKVKEVSSLSSKLYSEKALDYYLNLYKMMKEEITKAKKLIDNISDPNLKDSAQMELVQAYLNKGDLVEAKKLIDNISDPNHKARAQIELVKAYPNDDNLVEAKKLIGNIRDPKHKASAQIELVKAYPNDDNLVEAKKLIDNIRHPYFKAFAQIMLVKAYPNEENLVEAKKLIDNISDFYLKALTQIGLVKALLKKKSEMVDLA